MFLRPFSAWALLLCAASSGVAASSGIFNVQIAAAGMQTPPTPLVRHGDDWRYRFGTNAPQSDWKTAGDGLLNATWQTGPGGFGYEDGDDATLLTTMSNRFTTVYIRRQFEVPTGPNTNQQLRLIMDWDDGFVAWLDGIEIARSTNAPGAVGTEPAYNAVSLPPNHEASAGPGGNPPTVYNLGRAADRLEAGTHILAVMGLNGAINSSDLSLIADLDMIDSSAPRTPTADGYFSVISTSPITLTGTNTIPGAARVVVNGVDAVYSIAEGTWRKSQPLIPGMNRLFIAALDSSGAILAAISKDIVFESSTSLAGGTLAADAAWNSGVVRVTNDVIVPSGVTLSAGPGVVVLLSPTNSIKSRGGVIDVAGSQEQPVFFLPADATNAWRELSANGSGAALNLRHSELLAGQVIGSTNSTVLIEDSLLRDLRSATRLFVSGTNATMTLRRSHFTRYDQIRFHRTAITIEDCLFEDIGSDATDFSNQPNVQVLRTTYRRGAGSNTDAIDLGNNPGMLVDHCLIHHFGDKGVSIADDSHGTTVRNSLFHHVGSGISAYAASNLVFFNNTVSASSTGLFLRASGGRPAFGVASNMIVWGNNSEVSVNNGAALAISYSDVEGGVLPGTGNISADPQFINATAGDYRLSPFSPARNSGLGGVDMGATFPVGGIPPAPFHLAAVLTGPTEIQLRWQEDADNEAAFLVDYSIDGIQWERKVEANANETSVTLSGLTPDRPYYFRIKAYNSSGESRWSNVAVAHTRSSVSETFVGGTLTNHTTWSSDMGMIIVRSNVIVPTNIVLTITEGATIKMTNGVAIRAIAGGIINILGTESDKVTISRWNGTNLWNELAADGTNASLTIRHADLSGGTVDFRNNAAGLIEDSYIHEYLVPGSVIAGCTSAKAVTVRRSRFNRYHETLWQNTLMLVEHCLFENALNANSDCLDFDAAPPGSVIRRCTFRNGPQSNTDAIDIGPFGSISSVGVVIEDCIMHDFTDKGVSIGEDSFAIVVWNCLIYNVGEGVQVKDVSTASVYNNTIIDSDIGLHGFEKAPRVGGGRMTNTYNNILSGNRLAISIETNSIIVVNYTDSHGTNWPGTGNINADPLFLDPAARDYRLTSASPCIGAGSNGVNMGVTFPVGGIPAEPLNLIIVTNQGAQVLLGWTDASDHETGFVIEASTNAMNWTNIGAAPANASNALATTSAGIHFRIRATNFIGASFASNVATITGPPGDLDGDGMPDSWEDTYDFKRWDATDAGQDADGDGQSNVNEFRAGTDPRNASSRLGFNSVTAIAPDQVELIFIAQAGKNYAIEFRNSLSSGSWQNLIDVPAEATARPYTFTDTLPPGTQTRFYRLIIP